MGSKRIRNADRKMAREMAEAKRKHNEAMRIKVNREASTMDHIYAYMGKSNYNSQLMREGRGHFTFSK